MTQHNKIVCVSECPADVNDDIPLPQLIPKLERMGTLPLPVPHYLGKTVLPLLWKIDPNVPELLMGDTMRLTQIILNLCSNAVKVKCNNQ
jgi:signal transduction histidine kinase